MAEKVHWQLLLVGLGEYRYWCESVLSDESNLVNLHKAFAGKIVTQQVKMGL